MIIPKSSGAIRALSRYIIIVELVSYAVPLHKAANNPQELLHLFGGRGGGIHTQFPHVSVYFTGQRDNSEADRTALSLS